MKLVFCKTCSNCFWAGTDKNNLSIEIRINRALVDFDISVYDDNGGFVDSYKVEQEGEIYRVLNGYKINYQINCKCG